MDLTVLLERRKLNSPTTSQSSATCDTDRPRRCIANGKCCFDGEEACGSFYCYDPTTDFCCSDGQGSCPQGDTCCTYECCTDVGVCGSDGYCSANICTETSTYASTSYSTFTATVTEISEAEEAFAFSCAPITATNTLGDTLELGDDCLLTFSPSAAAATASATLHAGKREANPLPAPTLAPVLPRADCAYTSTDIVTTTVFSRTTRFTTVTETELSESFSCPPMSVTNAVGDELSLDAECSLSFSPAPNSPTTGTLFSIAASSASNLPTTATLFSGGDSGGSGGSSGSSGSSSGGPSPDGAAQLLISTSLVFGTVFTFFGAVLL